MKKLILSVTSIIVALSFNGYAQDSDSRSNLVFGLKAGANYSNIYDSQGDELKADGKIGLAAGAFLSVPIGKYLGIQPEVLFSQRGFHATGKVLGENYDISRTTNYLDIPIFVAFKPIEFLTILAGPQYSYLFQQKDSYSSGNLSIVQQQQFNNDNIRKNTFCFVGGLDFNLDHLVIGARAGWDLFNNNGDGTSTTPRYKNVWVQATVGFRLY